jgi:hypothetical protein
MQRLRQLVAGSVLAAIVFAALPGCGDPADLDARVARLEGDVVVLQKMQAQQDESNKALLDWIKVQTDTLENLRAWRKMATEDILRHSDAVAMLRKDLVELEQRLARDK